MRPIQKEKNKYNFTIKSLIQRNRKKKNDEKIIKNLGKQLDILNRFRFYKSRMDFFFNIE